MQGVPTQGYTYLPNNGALYTYNIPVAYNQANLDVPDLTYATSPESIASPRTPGVASTSLPPSKKPRTRKPKDPNHIGRTSNSFMIFRSELSADIQKTGNPHKLSQQKVSRMAGLLWRNLSSAEKQPYEDAAAEQSRKQREYRESHPESNPSKKRSSTSTKRARAQKPYDRPHRTVESIDDDIMPPSYTALPGPSTDQWLEPQPSQFSNPVLTQCIPTNAVDQTYNAPLDSRFGLNFDSTYWLMPSSIDTTTTRLPQAEQDLNALSAFNYDNWLLPSDTANTSLLNDQTYTQQLFDQFLQS